jgi:eukaryotic-like serine/threonine-protein kinase
MRIALLVAVLGALLAGTVGCSKTDEFVMPDITGKYWVEAEPQLRGLGWNGMLVLGDEVPGDPADRNRIVLQDPSAGTEHEKDVVITLRFAR